MVSPGCWSPVRRSRAIQQLGEGCWKAAMEQGRPLVIRSQIDARLVAAAGEHVMETLEHGSFASRRG